MSATAAPKPSQTALRRDRWNLLYVRSIALRTRWDRSPFFAMQSAGQWCPGIPLLVHVTWLAWRDTSRTISPSRLLMYNGPLEHVSEGVRKFVGHAWLDEESGTALMVGALPQRWFVVADKQDDRNRTGSRLVLQIVKQLPSVTAAQRQVCHDDVRVNIPSPAVGLIGVAEASPRLFNV